MTEGEVFVVHLCEDPSSQTFVGVFTKDRLLDACETVAKKLYPNRSVCDCRQEEDCVFVLLGVNHKSRNPEAFTLMFSVEKAIVNDPQGG